MKLTLPFYSCRFDSWPKIDDDHDDDDDDELFLRYGWPKAFSLIFSRDHCQRSSPSRISDTPRAGFEPAQNLSSGLVEWNFAIVITNIPRRHNTKSWISWEQKELLRWNKKYFSSFLKSFQLPKIVSDLRVRL